VEFAFRITPDSRAKKYTFELAMVDSYSGEALSREVEIPAEGGDGAPFPNGRLCRPPQIAAYIAEPIAGTAGKSGGTGASGAAAEPAQSPANLLVTDRAEVDLTVRITASQTPFNAWVTDSPASRHEDDPDKIFFAESRGTEPLKFTTLVPLKKGTNIIHVIATDENGLQGRETLVIRRK
jgi:hypothetical protein